MGSALNSNLLEPYLRYYTKWIPASKFNKFQIANRLDAFEDGMLDVVGRMSRGIRGGSLISRYLQKYFEFVPWIWMFQDGFSPQLEPSEALSQLLHKMETSQQVQQNSEVDQSIYKSLYENVAED